MCSFHSWRRSSLLYMVGVHYWREASMCQVCAGKRADRGRQRAAQSNQMGSGAGEVTKRIRCQNWGGEKNGARPVGAWPPGLPCTAAAEERGERHVTTQR